MKTLLVVTDHIGQDGTGRFLTYLVNELTKSGIIKIKLLIFHKEESEFNGFLNPDVEVICLDLKTRIRYSLFYILKKIVGIKPDYCLLGYTQLLWLGLFTFFMNLHGIKVFFRDTIIPSLYHSGDNKLITWLNKIAYHSFDKIIAQSIDMRNDLINNWGCNKNKVILINNPVKVDEVNQRAGNNCPDELMDKNLFTFVAAGRLDVQKGYDIIIQRMSELRDILNFRLLILGKGDLAETLQKLIDKNGLSEHVRLLGFKRNAASYIKFADALLLSSRYEGFPNIVLEAIALGKQVFSNNCPGGINEIIKEGFNGVACNFEDAKDFKKGLDRFLSYNYNSINIRKDAKTRYGAEVIMRKYIQIFS